MKREYKPVTTREMKVIKRLLKTGHPYKHMAEMLGRTEPSVRSIVEMYNLPRHPWYYIRWSKVPPELKEEILTKMTDWIEVERLTLQEMRARIKVIYGPELNISTISKWIKLLSKETKHLYRKNTRERKSRNAFRIHQRRKLRQAND